MTGLLAEPRAAAGSAETFITIVAIAHDADVVVAVSANRQALKELKPQE